MIKFPITLLFFLTIFSSCDFKVYGPGVQDFTKNLPNGYIVFRASSHQIKIVPEDGWNDKVPIIPTKVLKLNTYNEYVLAYRQGLKEKFPNNMSDSYMIPNPNEFDFWILDTKTPKVYNNLKKSEFDQIKKDLKIPELIKLIDVYKF